MNLFDDNEKNDYFESDETQPEKKKEPKKPTLKPEDPKYWEESDDEFENFYIHRKTRFKIYLFGGLAIFLIWLISFIYIRMFQPYVTEATQYGYVETLYKEGDVFKTFEGVLLPYKSLMDTTRVYEGDFVFSTSDANIAATLKEMQFACKPVKVEYSIYHSRMPWRGCSHVIVTRVDSVNERDILPADRRPSYLHDSNQNNEPTGDQAEERTL